MLLGALHFHVGQETTANMLCFSFILVHQHPQVLKRYEREDTYGRSCMMQYPVMVPNIHSNVDELASYYCL